MDHLLGNGELLYRIGIYIHVNNAQKLGSYIYIEHTDNARDTKQNHDEI